MIGARTFVLALVLLAAVAAAAAGVVIGTALATADDRVRRMLEPATEWEGVDE